MSSVQLQEICDCFHRGMDSLCENMQIIQFCNISVCDLCGGFCVNSGALSLVGAWTGESG